MTTQPTPVSATGPTLTELHEHQIVMALGLFDLTDRDRQLIAWLATWDQPTVDALADLLARLIRPAATR